MARELERRFTTHQMSPAKAEQAQIIRDEALRFSTLLDNFLPASRELSCALTHIEEASFWAVAGLARGPQ